MRFNFGVKQDVKIECSLLCKWIFSDEFFMGIFASALLLWLYLTFQAKQNQMTSTLWAHSFLALPVNLLIFEKTRKRFKVTNNCLTKLWGSKNSNKKFHFFLSICSELNLSLGELIGRLFISCVFGSVHSLKTWFN